MSRVWVKLGNRVFECHGVRLVDGELWFDRSESGSSIYGELGRLEWVFCDFLDYLDGKPRPGMEGGYFSVARSIEGFEEARGNER